MKDQGNWDLQLSVFVITKNRNSEYHESNKMHILKDGIILL